MADHREDIAVELGDIGSVIRPILENSFKGRLGLSELFDLYRNPAMTALGKKSMAFKITFQPADAALSQEDVNRFVNKIVGNLKYKLGAEMR